MDCCITFLLVIASYFCVGSACCALMTWKEINMTDKINKLFKKMQNCNCMRNNNTNDDNNEREKLLNKECENLRLNDMINDDDL